MAYADYEQYTNTYFGSMIPADSFYAYAERASEYLDYITLGRCTGKSDLTEVIKACCALAEEYYVVDLARADGEDIQSETVGSWSRTYRSKAEVIAGAESRMADIARRYLRNTGLLYRGSRWCDE